MNSLCGVDCVSCGYGQSSGCKGCVKSGVCPFGKQCFTYQYIRTGGIENYNAFGMKEDGT